MFNYYNYYNNIIITLLRRYFTNIVIFMVLELYNYNYEYSTDYESCYYQNFIICSYF